MSSIRYRVVCALLGVLVALGMTAAPTTAAPAVQTDTHLEYDQTTTGFLTETSAEQEWTFTGQAGDMIVIDMRANINSSLDGVLALLAPDGTSVATDDDSEGYDPRIGPYQLEESGTYTVVASSYTGNGEYTITVANLNAIPTITSGKPLVGTLDAQNQVDYFQIDLPDASDSPLMRFSISADSTYPPVLSVYTADGILATSYDLYGEPTEELDPVVLIPGEFAIVSVASGGGNYELSMQRSQLSLLEDGETVTGELSFDVYTQQHYLAAAEGDVLRITLSSEDDISPSLTLTDPTYDDYLLTTDGSAVRQISVLVTVPASGVYVIDVFDGSYLGGSGGSYTLRVDWRD